MSEPMRTAALVPAGKSRWFAVGAVTVAGAAFFAIASGGIGKNLVYYWGPTELRAAGDKAQGATIRLGGQVVPSSIHYDPATVSLDFHVRDSKADIPVHSTGAPPQMFRENIGVVVEGTMTSAGTFESSRLMVSHDNQYRAPKPGQEVQTAQLMSSTTGMSDEKK